MRLNKDNFAHDTVTRRFVLRDKEYYTECDRYSYESASTLYDVYVRQSDGVRTYTINCGFATDAHGTHKAIEKHFNLS